MKRLKFFLKSLAAIGCVLMTWGCEETIYPTLQQASPVIVVDAWINDLPVTQTIVLTWSQPYFESVVPPAVSGALVSVVDSHGKVFAFTENDSKPGHYEWTPTAFDELTKNVGYKLIISTSTEVFDASSYMGRVPPIDSITFEKDTQPATGNEITRAEFWATDPVGIGDAYWIRTYKNGVPLLKPSEINMAFDAGMSIGGQTDGVTFIAPVRRRINSNDQDEDGVLISPIQAGDSVHVQIHSVTAAGFTFLNELSIQTNRPGGFQELFSTPLANVSTNVVNRNPSGTRAVGFFNVSAVSSSGKRYTP